MLRPLKLSLTLLLAIAVIAGVAGGCFLSDYATETGFPHAMYIVELSYSPSAKNAWACTHKGVAYGADLSTFNEAKAIQDNCTLLAPAERLSDGSMNLYLGAHTWSARWSVSNVPPRHVPAAEIKSAQRVSF